MNIPPRHSLACSSAVAAEEGLHCFCCHCVVVSVNIDLCLPRRVAVDSSSDAQMMKDYLVNNIEIANVDSSLVDMDAPNECISASKFVK